MLKVRQRKTCGMYAVVVAGAVGFLLSGNGANSGASDTGKTSSVRRSKVEPAQEADRLARATAVRFMLAFFLDLDNDAALKGVDARAARKQDEPSSLPRFLNGPTAGGAERVALEQLVFFTKGDVADVKQHFPAGMWERVECHLSDGLGCLAVYDEGDPNRPGLLAVVVKQVEGQPRIVHMDGN